MICYCIMEQFTNLIWYVAIDSHAKWTYRTEYTSLDTHSTVTSWVGQNTSCRVLTHWSRWNSLTFPWPKEQGHLVASRFTVGIPELSIQTYDEDRLSPNSHPAKNNLRIVHAYIHTVVSRYCDVWWFEMLLIMIPDQYLNYYKVLEIYTGYFDSLNIMILFSYRNNERLLYFL